MKEKIDDLGIRRITIIYYKDPLIINKEIRHKANFYIKRGANKRNAYSKAASEVSNIQNTQVLNIPNSLELDPISDLVTHVAGYKRDYKFTAELIR